MALNCMGVREENERRYGTDTARIGPMLMASRYDGTHFLYELLQNGEAAMAQRKHPTDRRSIQFHLTEQRLLQRHFGKPFDDEYVRGISRIAESSKDLTAIGRFGICFKSVYAFTDRPELHSAAEHFAIETCLWPVEIPAPTTVQSPDRSPSCPREIHPTLSRFQTACSGSEHAA